jgi:hypothetical protein
MAVKELLERRDVSDDAGQGVATTAVMPLKWTRI